MNSYLVGFDFDGTIAATFRKSPNGIGVYEAYQKAIAEQFGNTAVEQYRSMPGNESMSPIELVVRLTGASDVQEETAVLDQAEMLVQRKLSILLGEVGTRFSDGSIWPNLEPGFELFWNALDTISHNTDFEVKKAVISSGHTEFINNTFNVHGLNKPDYLVTEDDVRSKKYPIELTRRVKPGTLQMALVHRQWLLDQGIRFNDGNRDQVEMSRDRMVYIGDSVVKDGGMAIRSKVPFIHYDGGLTNNGLTWTSIGDMFGSGIELFGASRSFQEIIGRYQSMREFQVRRSREKL